MKIAELLSVTATPATPIRDIATADAQREQSSPVPLSTSPPTRKLDMASLDRFAQQQQHQDAPRARVQDLSLNRIIQELHSDQQTTKRSADNDATLSASSSSVEAAAAMLSFTKSSALARRDGPPQPQQLAHGVFSNNIEQPYTAATAAAYPHDSPVSKRPVSTNVKPLEPNGDATQDAAASAVDEPAGARRRRARNGFAPLTESEKRVKQRQLVKRSYYRKIDTINELRDEAERLEDEFNTVLEGRRKHSVQHALSLSPFEVLREKYTALAISKDDLRHENEALRAVAADQSKARTRVGILLDEELLEQEHVARVAGLKSMRSEATALTHGGGSVSSGLSESESEQIVQIHPMTTAECMDVVKGAYARIMDFRAAQNLVSTGASVFGWRDRRKVEGDTMKFFLEKTFNRTAEDVATTMWGILSSETGVNRIYNAAIAIRFHLVQRVDTNNVVFYRTIEREGQGVVIKALVLGSLVQIDTGYMLLFHSLDPATRLVVPPPPQGEASIGAVVESSAFTRPEKREIWGDVFSWGLYEHAGESQELCCNSFGGFVPSSSATSVEFWLMHILLIAVRCETEAIGSLFTLQ